jgi:hypothetical protein
VPHLGAGEAGNAMDARGLNRLGEGHRRQDGGEPPCQHRRARPRGAEQEDVMVKTPASRSALPYTLGRQATTFPALGATWGTNMATTSWVIGTFGDASFA